MLSLSLSLEAVHVFECEEHGRTLLTKWAGRAATTYNCLPARALAPLPTCPELSFPRRCTASSTICMYIYIYYHGYYKPKRGGLILY